MPPIARAHRAPTGSLAMLVAFVAVACVGGATSSPGSHQTPGTSPLGGPSTNPTPTSPASTALILRITTEGGFIGPAANLAALPSVSVYADGRILTPGPVDAIYPGPLLVPVLVRNVGYTGAQAIVAAIRAAGLDHATSAEPGIPGDTGTTVFAVTLDGVTTTTRIAPAGAAPGPGGPGGAGGSQDPGTEAAKALLDRLADSSDPWGATAAPQTTLVPGGFLVYVPEGVLVYVAPGAPAAAEPSLAEVAVAWPLVTPLASFGVPAVPDRGIPGLRQGAVLGSEAATLAPLLQRATAITPFTSGGLSYTLYARALLPDEVPG